MKMTTEEALMKDVQTHLMCICSHTLFQVH